MMKPIRQHYFSTDFWLSQWFIVDGAVGSVVCVDMGSVTIIAEIHAECFLSRITQFDPACTCKMSATLAAFTQMESQYRHSSMQQ